MSMVLLNLVTFLFDSKPIKDIKKTNPKTKVIKDIWTFSNEKNLLLRNEKPNKAIHANKRLIFVDEKIFKKLNLK